MKQHLIILSSIGLLSAQNSSFNSFDVVIYPEYYFEGIMAEVDAEVKEDKFPLKLRMNIPTSSDSVFFVSGATNGTDVETLSILKEGKASFIEVNIEKSRFRLFIFYDLIKNNSERTGSFELNLNHSIDDAHLIVQEPLVAENFTFSEKDFESFQDQHSLNFRRIHLNNYKANSSERISFGYTNPSGNISINLLQTRLSNDESINSAPQVSPSTNPPLRHKLPLWQPLMILGVVSVLVGWMFSVQLKNEKSGIETNSKNGKFCTHCGNPVQSKNKFCANCGGKL